MSVTKRSTHTLPRLGLDTICIDDQESEIAESVPVAERVVICWSEVGFEELIYLLNGAVEEWHRCVFFNGYMGFYIMDDIRR